MSGALKRLGGHLLGIAKETKNVAMDATETIRPRIAEGLQKVADRIDNGPEAKKEEETQEES